jgi:hypothetical protein
VKEDIQLDYQALARDALRRVVHDVLTLTVDLKATPGQHHFYIEFLTEAPGVQMPERLRADYPERMTIVLQHQFEDLAVEQDKFAVTLRFKGVPSRLVIPFDAMTSFYDPHSKFALSFEDPAAAKPQDEEPAAKQAESNAAEAETDAPKPAAAKEPAHKDAQIVSLDQFRKK